MPINLLEYTLPSRLYRRLLILTDAWQGVRSSAGSLLIRCHTGGEALPFYWAGTPDTLSSFYESLGQDRSIYCLCGTYGVLPPSDENIRALATYYAAEIIKAQPQGPYLLGGYCEAGLLTYEIAQILLKHQYEIGLLVLFDRDVTDNRLRFIVARKLFKRIENTLRRWEQLLENPSECIKDILNNKHRQWVTISSPASDLHVLPDTERYTLTDYPGAIHLIFIRWGLLGYFQFNFFQRYWREKALGGIHVQVIAGSAHNDPNWPVVATLVQSLIKQSSF